MKPAPPDVLVAFRLFMSLHYGSWLVCIFFVGVCNGVIWGFLNWHLENIGKYKHIFPSLIISKANVLFRTSKKDVLRK